MASQNEKIYTVQLPLSLFISVIGALVVVIGSGIVYIATGHVTANEGLRDEFHEHENTAISNFDSLEVAINELITNQNGIILTDATCRERQIVVEVSQKAHGERLRDLERITGITKTELKECMRMIYK